MLLPSIKNIDINPFLNLFQTDIPKHKLNHTAVMIAINTYRKFVEFPTCHPETVEDHSRNSGTMGTSRIPLHLNGRVPKNGRIHELRQQKVLFLRLIKTVKILNCKRHHRLNLINYKAPVHISQVQVICMYI